MRLRPSGETYSVLTPVIEIISLFWLRILLVLLLCKSMAHLSLLRLTALLFSILATTFFPVPSLYPRIFHSLILVEPALVPPKYIDPSQHTPLFRSISKLMASRKDTWSSRDEARTWMENRLPWGAWDERVLRIYIEYGLGKLQGADGTELESEVVTLMCTKSTETLAYERGMVQGQPGLWQLNLLCNVNAGKETKGAMGKSVLPIHVVWGEVDDLFSREVKDSLEDREQGRVFTTVRRVEDVGHMVRIIYRTVCCLLIRNV